MAEINEHRLLTPQGIGFHARGAGSLSVSDKIKTFVFGRSGGRRSAYSAGITWISDSEFECDGLRYRLATSNILAQKSDNRVFFLCKDRSFVEWYASRPHPRPRRILEFGVLQGGSTLFLASLFDVDKLVAIEKDSPLAVLDEVLRRRRLRDRVVVHYNTQQEDRDRVHAIIREDFGDEPPDLIVDDASHFYAETRASFETAFPWLAPSGSYIIEDWGWAHWDGSFQSDAYFLAQSEPLSRLVFELTMCCASHPYLIESVTTFPSMAIVKKAAQAPLGSPIDLRELVLKQGRDIRL